jgi:putative intracellular protease/amidase
VDCGDFAALMTCGGQSPMFTFRDSSDQQHAVRVFYETETITAAFCHGVSTLDTKTSTDDYLVAGKTVTGF